MRADMVRGMLRWLWCMVGHEWTRYDAVRYGAGPYDADVETVCYCRTCGRGKPSWLPE